MFPWLTTKKFIFMLVLLIPRKKSVKNKNIDVYLVSLLEELQELWTRVFVTQTQQLVIQENLVNLSIALTAGVYV
jgi:hypothetical protein